MATLHDATVVTYLQMLGALDGFLKRGFDHCRDNNLDPEEIVDARIHADMLPFRFQVICAAHHSLGAIEAVKRGEFNPPTMNNENYTSLQQLVSDARTALQKLSADEVNALATRDTKFRFRDREIPFTGEGFLLSFSIPNFFFHSTMAYAILRMKGVPLGKRDFMGQLRIKS
jgi:hypothetical protein